MRNLSILFIIIPFLFTGCSGCSRSGRMRVISGSLPVDTGATVKGPVPAGGPGASGTPPGPAPAAGNAPSDASRTTVHMQKVDGVYKIPVKVDGSDMDFIFDTGAGMISISNVEASYLYKAGKLKDTDIVGQANFMDATGNISPGTIVILREISIGNRTIHDVRASVVNNAQAPLLFGQSALEKFGKISIDYAEGTISFE